MMRRQIAAPKNWQDFEELCLRLWRDMWGDPHAQKNGRVGQNQHGIDEETGGQVFHGAMELQIYGD